MRYQSWFRAAFHSAAVRIGSTAPVVSFPVISTSHHRQCENWYYLADWRPSIDTRHHVANGDRFPLTLIDGRYHSTFRIYISGTRAVVPPPPPCGEAHFTAWIRRPSVLHRVRPRLLVVRQAICTSSSLHSVRCESLQNKYRLRLTDIPRSIEEISIEKNACIQFIVGIKIARFTKKKAESLMHLMNLSP